MLLEVSRAGSHRASVPSQPQYVELLDRARPHELVGPSADDLRHQIRRAANLDYRYSDTNETITVPNVWYNQPVQWRIDALSVDIQRWQENLKRLESQGVCAPDPVRFCSPEEERQDAMGRARDMIARLEGIVAAMERTGVVTH